MHSEDLPINGRHLQRAAQAVWFGWLGFQRCLSCDIPNKPSTFPGNNSSEDARLGFARPAEGAISLAKPRLRFPANVFDVLWQMF